jgi:acyl-coenzyme A synthetase/AMP-(fatty) acid ligase
MQAVSDRTAIVWRGTTTSYGDLLEKQAAWSSDLDALGVVPGEVVALVGDYSPGACAAMLALIDRGAIIMPLTEATAPLHDEYLSLGQAQRVVRFSSDDSWESERRDAEVTHALLRDLISRGMPGLIMFSSGSTGKSKAMVHDFGRVLEKFVVRRQALVTLTFLLFDHMGGLNTLLHTLSNDGTVVATQDRDPEAVCGLVQDHHVELLPVSPTFLSLLLLSGVHRSFDMSSLKVISYGSEVMPQATLDRMRAEFPTVRLQQTYGLSETGALRTKSREDGSLWLKVGGEGVETKVVDGTLWIRSRYAMLGYLNAPDPFDADGWLDTQDKVEVDGDYIKILGRTTDIINVGGNKVYPAEVESVLLEMGNVSDALCFAESNPIMGEVVAAQIRLEQPESLADFTRRMRAHTRGRLERFKVPVRVEIVDHSMVNARFKKIRTSGANVPGTR